MKTKQLIILFLVSFNVLFSQHKFNIQDFKRDIQIVTNDKWYTLTTDKFFNSTVIFNFSSIYGQFETISKKDFNYIKNHCAAYQKEKNIGYGFIRTRLGGTHKSYIIPIFIFNNKDILFRFTYSDETIQRIIIYDNYLILKTQASYMSFDNPYLLKFVSFNKGNLQPVNINLKPSSFSNIIKINRNSISFPHIRYYKGIILRSAVDINKEFIELDLSFCRLKFKIVDTNLIYFNWSENSEATANNLQNVALKLYKEKKYSEALNKFQEAFLLNPLSFTIASNLSITYYMLKLKYKFRQSTAYSYLIAENNNQKAIALYNTGLYYLMYERYKSAKDAFTASLKLRENKTVRKKLLIAEEGIKNAFK